MHKDHGKFVIMVRAMEGLATGQPIMLEDAMLISLDVDYDNGAGRVEFTTSVSEAKKFDTIEEAHEFWMTQSTVRPLLPDGQANRPFTRYAMEVMGIES